MKKTLIISVLLLTASLSALISIGQPQFELPQNIELKTKEDYVKFETTVIDAAKWLEQTDLDKEGDKRKQINAFVIQWITGTPTLTVNINEQLAKLYGKNVQLLAIYLASYARNVIELKEASSKLTATKAGLVSMMNVYKKGIEISKNKELDKIIKMTDSELDSYIVDKFK